MGAGATIFWDYDIEFYCTNATRLLTEVHKFKDNTEAVAVDVL